MDYILKWGDFPIIPQHDTSRNPSQFILSFFHFLLRIRFLSFFLVDYTILDIIPNLTFHLKRKEDDTTFKRVVEAIFINLDIKMT